MHNFRLLLSFIVMAIMSMAHATPLPAEVNHQLAQAQWAGNSSLKFLGMRIYDAKLWVAPGFRPEKYADSTLVLELTYQRTLYGKLIAERSLKEMQRGGKIDATKEKRWIAAMEKAFPDVKAGDRIIGVHVPAQGARFWHNGTLRAEINDTEFSQLFFGIWLASHTSEPRLRTELLARLAP
jgi:hypothetical protein